MIRVKVNDDHSMNLEDLKMKLEKVISEGGIPTYILATMGTTDTFGIDDIEGIKSITNELEQKYHLNPYPGAVRWYEELEGALTTDEVVEINEYNASFAELIGKERERVYFGNTSRQRLIHVCDSNKRLPVYVHKFFSISPYTTIEEVERYILFLKEHMDVHQKLLVLD